ncbi:MAG TPA: hybrid sensor histidine kinase/response regulator [Rhodocyclaceae bacterium]
MTPAIQDDPQAAPNRLIELEQMRMLYHQLATSTSASVLAAVVLIASLWQVLPSSWLLWWLAAMTLNQLWRVRLYRKFLQFGITLDSLAQATTAWVAGAAISALLWATANLLFFVPDSPLHQALLMALSFAVLSVAVPLLSAHLPSLFIFVVPILSACILRNLWAADAQHGLLAIVAAAAMAGMLAVGRKYNQLLSASQRARFDNAVLAVRLSQQNAELETARNAAVQADVAKSKFLAAASHDLRQPLHALTLFADALSQEANPDEMAKLTRHIGTSVTALESLFSSLLDISKLDAGVVRRNEIDFRAQDLFDRIVNDFAPLAEMKRLRLRAGSTAAHFRSDPILLEQLLRNLVGNAVRYTARGTVLLACRRCGGKWRIEVRDSGIGIPADQHEKVFEEFYQLDNAERDRQKGLGLGLAIVARLSRLLGCPVTLRSAPGRGTVMSVTVPAGVPMAEAEAAQAPAPDGFAGMRVVIVDDEAEVRAAMQTIMEKWGCETVAAESLREAVAKMTEAQWEPELAISDYRLKDGDDGIRVLDRLRERYGDALPCLLMTGDIEAERLKAVRESGYPLLHKPIPPGKLRAAAASLGSRARDAV